MKFVHIADCHLGIGFKTASFARKLGNRRRKEIKETLFRVIAYCEDEGIDLLLIAGDLFEDDYVAISDLNDLNYRFSKLTQTQVVIGAGNHDPIGREHTYYQSVTWCDQVHILGEHMTQLYLEKIETSVYGFSWTKRHLSPLKEKMLPSIEQIHSTPYRLLMLHGDAYTKGDMYQYIDRNIIEGKGFDYVALGHIHKPDFITPWMAYPGSLEPLDFKETGAHGLIRGEINEAGLTATFLPFSKRIFVVLEHELVGKWTYAEIKESLLEKIRGHRKDDMYRIKLVGYLGKEVVLDLEQLKEMLEEEVYYVEIQDATQLDLDIEQLKKDYEGTFIGAFIQHVEALEETSEIQESILYEGLRILLDEEGRV